MKPIHPKTDVVPLSDFRANVSELLKQTQQTGRPIVITQHGRGVGILLSADEYEKLLGELETATGIVAGQTDIIAGRTIPHDHGMRELDEIVAGAKKKKQKSKRKGKSAA